MASALDPKAPRTTSTFNSARNDTGRTAYCGPIVVSAITGYPVSKVEEKLRKGRGLPEGEKPVIQGTYSGEVASALAAFGYRMELVESFEHLERKARPTLWSWMQRPRSAWAYYILAVSKGREGHWILIRGVKICDTYTDGQWKFVCDGPHRGARIVEIFSVRRAVG